MQIDDGMVNVDYGKIGPKNLCEILQEAHGVAHRHAASMGHWLKHRGMSWRGMSAQCEALCHSCEECMRVNASHHGMGHYVIHVGDKVGITFSFDLLFFRTSDGLEPVVQVIDNLSLKRRCAVLGAVAGVDAVLGRKLWTVLQKMFGVNAAAGVGADAVMEKTMVCDNETRLSEYVVEKLKSVMNCTLLWCIPNVHGNGICERANRTLRACPAESQT